MCGRAHELAVARHGTCEQGQAICTDLQCQRAPMATYSIGAAIMTETTSSVRKTRRSYQRGLSKQMMNVSKYKVSGKIHKKGTTATSWQI